MSDQIPMDALVARHQQEQNSVTDEDVLHIAGLFKTVGNELHTVDHHYVGSNSNTRALQLDQKKVFNAPIVRNNPQPPPQVQAPPVQPTAEQEAEDIASAVENRQPVIREAAQPPSPASSNELNELSERLSKLETKFNKVIKGPHRKFNVKFKSEHLSGVFDDFDELVDSIRKSLNKSSKRITITLNEN